MCKYPWTLQLRKNLTSLHPRSRLGPQGPGTWWAHVFVDWLLVETEDEGDMGAGKSHGSCGWKAGHFDSRLDFARGSEGKESACNARDVGLIPGSERSPGGGPGYPLQYSCLENPMDREAWRAAVHGVSQSQTQLRVFLFTSDSRSHRLAALRLLSETWGNLKNSKAEKS